MYESIRKLFQCRDLNMAGDLENEQQCRELAEQTMQLQVLAMKDISEERKKLMFQYLDCRNQLEQMKRENAYIEGYLMGSRLMQEALSAKE